MEIIKADTIEQYNRFFGFQTRHPLVGIVHFDRSESIQAISSIQWTGIEAAVCGRGAHCRDVLHMSQNPQK